MPSCLEFNELVINSPEILAGINSNDCTIALFIHREKAFGD